MVDAAELTGPGGPHLHFVEAEAARALIARCRLSGSAVFVGSLRGIRTPERLIDELSRTLDLPDYFGRNWDALDECLRDLPERAGAEACVLFLCDAYAGWQDSTLLMAQLVECWLLAAARSEVSGAGLHLVFAW